jgi:tRNA-dihydrouridine synthase
MPARIAASLAEGKDPGPPPIPVQAAIAVGHVEDMLTHHGSEHGLRGARKHIGWYLATSGRSAEVVKAWRRRLCTLDRTADVLAGLRAFYEDAQELAA